MSLCKRKKLPKMYGKNNLRNIIILKKPYTKTITRQSSNITEQRRGVMAKIKTLKNRKNPRTGLIPNELGKHLKMLFFITKYLTT